MMRMIFARLVLAAVLSGGLAPAMAQAEAMTGAELTALLGKGKALTLGGEGHGYKGLLKLTARGKGTGKVVTGAGDTIAFSGQWKIIGDQFCRVWKGGSDSGKQVCETWEKTGPRSVNVLKDGESIGVNSW